MATSFACRAASERAGSRPRAGSAGDAVHDGGQVVVDGFLGVEVGAVDDEPGDSGVPAGVQHAGEVGAIRTYEEAMFTRTHPIARVSARVQAMMLSPTAAEDIVRFFTARPVEPASAD
jgi:hypothetical protein